jgi:hypothetical protein
MGLTPDDVFTTLDGLSVEYQVHTHAAVATVEAQVYIRRMRGFLRYIKRQQCAPSAGICIGRSRWGTNKESVSQGLLHCVHPWVAASCSDHNVGLQDKKHRYYICTALPDSKVDLKSAPRLPAPS